MEPDAQIRPAGMTLERACEIAGEVAQRAADRKLGIDPASVDRDKRITALNRHGATDTAGAIRMGISHTTYRKRRIEMGLPTNDFRGRQTTTEKEQRA